MAFVDSNKTPSIKGKEIKETWFLVDAENMVLGRLSTYISAMLRGKFSTQYTPHMDMQIKIIVINADKIVLTKQKMQTKLYVTHTMRIGSLKTHTAQQLKDKRGGSRLLFLAVKRMMQSGALFHNILSNLFIYDGADHPHAAQQPKPHQFKY